MKKLIITTSLLISILFVYSQDPSLFEGYVRDSLTKKTIPFAAVYIQPYDDGDNTILLYIYR